MTRSLTGVIPFPLTMTMALVPNPKEKHPPPEEEEDDEDEGLRWFSCPLFHNNYRDMSPRKRQQCHVADNNYRPVSKKETAMSCCRQHSTCQRMHLKPQTGWRWLLIPMQCLQWNLGLPGNVKIRMTLPSYLKVFIISGCCPLQNIQEAKKSTKTTFLY